MGAAEIQPEGERQYNRAFEAFVESDEDLVGLLAYSLYKQVIYKQKIEGKSVVQSAQRNPVRNEVDIYRNQAEIYLRAFSQTAIKEETPRILREALDTKLRGAGAFWYGVFIGVVAWIISLGITILVTASAPEWVRSLVQHIQGP